jgi:intracellular multiplication protein IcmB
MQTTWNDIIFAVPGSGKSVLMNSNNLASILTPGSNELSMIGIIDIGPSSAGLIQLIKDALPQHLKHLAVYERLQNTDEYAINVFDTQLGSRYPSSADKMFLTNFLSLLMTPAGETKPYPSSDNMAGAVVEELYKYFSDSEEGHPKEYSEGQDPVVDKVLDDYSIDATNWSWWDVVDKLFELGKLHEASMAQRFAVPFLEDSVKIAETIPSIYDVYSIPKVVTEESMIQLFKRAIGETIKQFPILNKPTKFDLADARIISLDLDEVAKSGTPTAEKQTGIMYMMARYVIGKNYKLDKDFVKACPKQYQRHHFERAKKIKQVKKRICFDEFHRTASIPSVRGQVKTDQREGRKWNLQVILASQISADFDKDMLEMATGVFIMSGGANYEEIGKLFNLNETTKQIVKDDLNGPSSKGVPFVFNFTTKTGVYSQYLYSTISPVELWAFSTTSEDVVLRGMLTDRLNSASLARRVLAREFGGGGSKKYIEDLVSNSVDPDVIKDPYSYIIESLVEKTRVELLRKGSLE